MPKRIYNVDKNTTIQSKRVLPNGSIVASVVLARAGIYEYLGKEIGLFGADSEKVFRVYRPEEAIFNQRAMDSFKNIPLTIHHPPEMITPENAKQYQEGLVGSNIGRMQDLLVGEVTMTTQDAIDAADTMNEVSIGFYTEYEYTPGVTPSGESYDVKQLALEGNHLALVPAGRCGNRCKIFDNKPSGDNSMPEQKISVKIGGIDCQLDAAVAPVIQNVLQTADSIKKDLESQVSELNTTVSTQQATIDSLTNDLNAAKAAADSAVTMEALDGRVETINKALAMDSSLEWKGKDCVTLMKEALSSVDKKLDLSDKDDAYITAYFDIVSGKTKSSLDKSLEKSAEEGSGEQLSAVDKARAKSIEEGGNAFIGNHI